MRQKKATIETERGGRTRGGIEEPRTRDGACEKKELISRNNDHVDDRMMWFKTETLHSRVVHFCSFVRSFRFSGFFLRICVLCV